MYICKETFVNLIRILYRKLETLVTIIIIFYKKRVFPS